MNYFCIVQPFSNRAIPTVLLVATIVGVGDARAVADDKGALPRRAKKLIEFGWDEPDTAFMRKHIAKMEETPFHGCVFHVMTSPAKGNAENFIWACWGKRAFTDADLKLALADLQATPFRRFTENFLRFNTSPGEIDWFDDFNAVCGNAALAARVARAGKCKGILFDVEEYQGKLFTYQHQRDAKTKTWEAYAAQARRRGREVMQAFQSGFPDVVVLLTFGHSLPRVTSKHGKLPLSESNYGLLAPFVDGMVDAAKGNARIVDGFELSYSYKDRPKFVEGRDLMKKGVLPIVADPQKYQQYMSSGFGIWMDYDWRSKGWDLDNLDKNHFTPATFEAAVRHAVELSDEYVWIYTETPRWWTDAGTPVKLPKAYADALRNAAK